MTDCKTIQNIEQLLLNPDWRPVAVHTASPEQFKIVIAGLFELAFITASDARWQGNHYVSYQIHRKGLSCKLFIHYSPQWESYEARAVYWDDKFQFLMDASRFLSFQDLKFDLRAIDSLLTQFCGDLQKYLKSL